MGTRIKLVPRTTGKTITTTQQFYNGDTSPVEQVVWYRQNNDGTTTKMSLKDIHNRFSGEQWKLYQDGDGNYYADLAKNVPEGENIFKKKTQLNTIQLEPHHSGAAIDDQGQYYTTGHWMSDGPLKVYKQDEWNEMTESEYESLFGTPYTRDTSEEAYYPYDAVYYDGQPYLVRTQEYDLPEITVYPTEEEKQFVQIMPKELTDDFSYNVEHFSENGNQKGPISRFLNLYNQAGKPKISIMTKSPNSLRDAITRFIMEDRAHYKANENTIMTKSMWDDIEAELAHPIQFVVQDEPESYPLDKQLNRSFWGELFNNQDRYDDSKHFEYQTHKIIEPQVHQYIFKGTVPSFMDQNGKFVKIPYQTIDGKNVYLSK